jgi:hypothetical protein
MKSTSKIENKGTAECQLAITVTMSPDEWHKLRKQLCIHPPSRELSQAIAVAIFRHDKET